MPFVEIELSELEFYERLGSGAAGTVYRSLWKGQEKVVAVKKLLQLETEAEVLSSLSHRNIVQFLGAVVKPPNFCLVTEFAEFGSLYDYLRKFPIEFRQILLWAKQIALGMNYLHYEAPAPVMHRDLKSKNVVIAGDLTAKLCDFGSSKFHLQTTKISVVGTFPWMAPEVIQQLPVSPACDVYSYSIVLWELLTREVPFKGLEGLQVAWLVVSKDVRLTIPSSCPPLFADLMRKCWVSEPKERLDFKQVLERLQNMLENESLEEETKSFLKQKDKWKKEIEEKLETLKNVRGELSNKELQLREREKELDAREKQLVSMKRTSLHGNHDVNGWTEDDVVNWIQGLPGPELASYSEVFLKNHITGCRLFLLTGNDLLQIGVLSVGHRKELLVAMESLRQENHRLLHFPPLFPGSKNSSRSKLQELNQVVSLAIIFTILQRPTQKRWKIMVDVDGSLAATSAIKEIQLILCSSIPADIVQLQTSPYIMEDWREGPIRSTVNCVIYYKDHVKKPRETSYKFATESVTSEIQVDLELGRPREERTPVNQGAHSRPLTPSMSSSSLSGVWAARADYLPHHLEPREVESLLLSPRQQQGESPSPSRDPIPLGEISGLTAADDEEYEERETETASSMTERDKKELERGIREALFRKGGETPTAVSRPYKGRPLKGVWATAGQTGASVVIQTGELVPGGPVKFSISSPGGSSSGQATPQRSGSRTPSSRQTPPPKSRGSNWSTQSPSVQRRHGNRGAYRHSKSGPERSYEAEHHREKAVPRRYYSEQYLWGTDQSDRPNESHDDTHQSDVNNWNIHIPRSHRGNSERRGRGRGNQSSSRREGGEGGGRGRGERQSRRGSREGGGQDHYQRSQSDKTDQRHTRGAPAGRHRNPPYTEPKEQSYN